MGLISIGGDEVSAATRRKLDGGDRRWRLECGPDRAGGRRVLEVALIYNESCALLLGTKRRRQLLRGAGSLKHADGGLIQPELAAVAAVRDEIFEQLFLGANLLAGA